MDWGDVTFLIGRVATSALYLYAAYASASLAATYAPHSRRRRRGQLGVALMIAIGLLVIATGLEEGVHRAGEAIRPLDWVWLFLDALTPSFYLLMLRSMRERDALERELAQAAEHDPLTHLPNRKGFESRALVALTEAARRGEPCVAAMLDIDHFKSINDGWGHAAGDDVLRGLASTARVNLRRQDCIGRMGGEEFALVLPGLTPQQALPLVDRLREAISALVPHPGAPERRLTVSGGLAAIRGSDAAALEAALNAADAALYEAKTSGRNRAVIG